MQVTLTDFMLELFQQQLKKLENPENLLQCRIIFDKKRRCSWLSMNFSVAGLRQQSVFSQLMTVSCECYTCYISSLNWAGGLLAAPWCHDVMISWCHDALMSWYHDVMMSWCHDVMMSWSHDVMVPWCHDAMMSWCHDVMMSWCHDECYVKYQGRGIFLAGLAFTSDLTEGDHSNEHSD